MRFNSHFKIAAAGSHAFLSASKYAWINYDDDKLDAVFAQSMAAEKGTRLHLLAGMMIKEGVKATQNSATFNKYVNDAIGFRMNSEQILYYSDNAYGCADAICFRDKKLRIHDLKTGITPASFHQLEVYAALFCLEYKVNPFDIYIELRIYQNDEVQILVADPDAIMHIMEKIKRFDKRITEMRLEAAGL